MIQRDSGPQSRTVKFVAAGKGISFIYFSSGDSSTFTLSTSTLIILFKEMR